MMIERLNDISWIITIVQIVMGGLVFSVFRLWLFREEDIRKTISLRKENKIEDVCVALKNVFHRALNEDIPLRGEAGEHPDLLLDFSKKAIQTSNLFQWYKKCHLAITRLTNYLIISAFTGAMFLVLAFVLEKYIYIIGLASILVITSQIIVFFTIRKIGLKLNEFDEL